MSVILIPTVVEDIHAYAAAIVLERMGHRALLWHCSDLPERESASVQVGPRQPTRLSLHSHEFDGALDDVDVFWNRRIGTPVVQTELLACDRVIAVNQSERFVRSLLASLSRDRFAVNAFSASRNAEDKVLQLTLAQRLGLDLPATLVSGDPAMIRRFVAAHEERGAVVKNFTPIAWKGDTKLSVNFTAKVTSAMLPRDGMLRLTPAIYQGYVPKRYEVRVTCMGGEQVAAALHSQHQPGSSTDWRAVAPHTLAIERIELPSAIAQQCKALMQALDLRFGCFDFIVTPDGRWVFLELNQMGQFLWLEEADAELPLLQMFCDFLVSKDPGFRYTRRGTEARYADVVAEACERMQAATDVHCLPVEPPHVYVESAGRAATSVAV